MRTLPDCRRGELRERGTTHQVECVGVLDARGELRTDVEEDEAGEQRRGNDQSVPNEQVVRHRWGDPHPEHTGCIEHPHVVACGRHANALGEPHHRRDGVAHPLWRHARPAVARRAWRSSPIRRTLREVGASCSGASWGPSRSAIYWTPELDHYKQDRKRTTTNPCGATIAQHRRHGVMSVVNRLSVPTTAPPQHGTPGASRPMPR